MLKRPGGNCVERRSRRLDRGGTDIAEERSCSEASKQNEDALGLRVLGLSAVLVDLAAAHWSLAPTARLLIAGTFLLLALWRLGWQPAAVGLGRGSPLAWRTWSALAVFGVLVGVTRLAYSRAATGVFAYGLPLESAARGLANSVLIVPVLEEGVYRAILCSILLRGLDGRLVVAVSAVVFGLLHVLYGQMLPEHFLWGAVFAWVYLKTNALWLAILLHGLGNLASAAVPVVVWYGCGGQMWC